MLNRRNLITGVTANLESDATLTSLPTEVLVNSADATIADLSGIEQDANAYADATAEEVVALESCIGTLRSLINLESAVETLVESGVDASTATSVVEGEVIARLEELDPALVEEETPSLESDGKDGFWTKVKAMATKIKEAIVNLFNSLKERITKGFTNLIASSKKIKTSADALIKLIGQTNNWEVTSIDARPSWIVRADASTHNVLLSIKHSAKNVEVMNRAIVQIQAKVDSGDTDTKVWIDEDEEYMPNIFIGYYYDSDKEEYAPFKASDLNEGAKMEGVERTAMIEFLHTLKKAADRVDHIYEHTMTKWNKDMLKKLDDDIKLCNKLLANNDTQYSKEDLQKELARLSRNRKVIATITNSSSWIARGLPYASLKNGLTFASEMIKASTAAK